MPVKITAKNFQSIKEATIEVDRFTVVTGPNNSGKTALQRAARGVFQNTRGSAFIRHGETQCSVEVDFGEDGKVEWSKGTGKRDRPAYVINGGPPIYPGASVPDEVAAFGVVPIEAGGQDVWPTIAPQFTGQIFLLDRPGSALAEAVADVERVGQLNRALRSSEKDKRQAAAALKVRKGDLADHVAEVGRFHGLDDAVEAIDALDAKRKKLVNVAMAINGLARLRERLQTARCDVKKLAPVADVLVPTPDAGRDLRIDLAKWGGLGDLRDRLQIAQASVVQMAPVANITLSEKGDVEALLSELSAMQDLGAHLDAARAEEAKYTGVGQVLVDVDETPTNKILAALDVLQRLSGGLSSARSSVMVIEDELEQAEVFLVEAISAADAVLAEIGQCPTCGTIVRPETVEGVTPC